MFSLRFTLASICWSLSWTFGLSCLSALFIEKCGKDFMFNFLCLYDYSGVELNSYLKGILLFLSFAMGILYFMLNPKTNDLYYSRQTNNFIKSSLVIFILIFYTTTASILTISAYKYNYFVGEDIKTYLFILYFQFSIIMVLFKHLEIPSNSYYRKKLE